ncbi:MAG: ribosomal protein L7/L12 [Gemmataceae bacterium]|nr:ribosomal protein L7/L12 [Gemmataceae bacterium]
MSAAAGRAWTPEVLEIGDRIASLTVAHAAELSGYLREIHRIVPAEYRIRLPPPPPPPLPPPAPAEAAVRLEGYEAARKASVIKAVREIVGLGLKEAKALVDAAPVPVGPGKLPLAQAEALKRKLEEAGAMASLQP